MTEEANPCKCLTYTSKLRRLLCTSCKAAATVWLLLSVRRCNMVGHPGATQCHDQTAAEQQLPKRVGFLRLP